MRRPLPQHLCTPFPSLLPRFAAVQMRDAPRDSRMAPSVHAFTAAMRAASEGGRWEAALAIWDDMQKAGCKPTGACMPGKGCALMREEFFLPVAVCS